jgi:hypothetical protein
MTINKKTCCVQRTARLGEKERKFISKVIIIDES